MTFCRQKKSQLPIVNRAKLSAPHRIRCQTEQKTDGQHVTDLLNKLRNLCWEIMLLLLKLLDFARRISLSNGNCDHTLTQFCTQTLWHRNFSLFYWWVYVSVAFTYTKNVNVFCII